MPQGYRWSVRMDQMEKLDKIVVRMVWPENRPRRSKQKALTQCSFNAGPPSTTVDQH